MSLYNTLGVTKNASPEEIKSAFKKKAMKNHPDRGGDNKKMAEISEAYLVLSNPATRDRYDKTGKTKQDPFEQRFMGLVDKILSEILNQVDVDYTDITKVYSDTITGMKKQAEEKLKDYEKKIKKAESVLKRLKSSGNKTIITVTQLNIEDFKKNIYIFKEEIEFFEKALIAVKDYQYSVEERDEFTGFINRGFVGFT